MKLSKIFHFYEPLMNLCQIAKLAMMATGTYHHFKGHLDYSSNYPTKNDFLFSTAFIEWFTSLKACVASLPEYFFKA